ncbi:MAG: 5'-3' exonuclease H3TH domain-containing protein [Candidatus Peregrinibacteria bacterium]|nr:5'-3' exonuclease H3TH domain-containing protein [Candidatus Peregrinibacteria bacterium]
MNKKKFVIIDGHALIYRGYYAVPPLRTQKGELVNAVFGFTTVLLNMLQKVKPDYLAVAFDLKGPTFRHDAYDGYKATRSATPDDLLPQVPRVKQVARAFQIPIFEQEGFEADDMIATISTKLKAYSDIEYLIVTGDMDLTQLVSEQVKLLSPLSGFNNVKTYDVAAVIEKFGVRPDQMIDFKALMGDTSDNIIGVPGIGKVTATKLLQQYETLDGIYEHIEETKGAVKTKLEAGKEAAYQSQHLVQLIHDVELELDLEACHTHEVDGQQVRLLFGELEFRRLITKFDELHQGWQITQQPALF